LYFSLEVPAHLVVATVFKIAVPRVNRTAGGFDSHALPFLDFHSELH